MITIGAKGYAYSDFVLGVYDIQKDEQNFETALNNKAFTNNLSWHCGIGNDEYYYIGIDYLPDEVRAPFLKALNEGYQNDESAKFRPFGLEFFNQLVSDTYVTHYDDFRHPENLEKYGFSFKERFEFWKDFYNKSPLSEQERENFTLSCQIYEKFLDYLGPLADKTILRDSDKSTLYPPNNLSSVNFKQNYQFIFQITQQSTLQKDKLLFELLNLKE